MRWLDKVIRSWRTRVAIRYAPKNICRVFDIGCGDGFLLKKIAHRVLQGDGCDIALETNSMDDRLNLMKGAFLNVLHEKAESSYDTIFALAVFEHFPEEDMRDTVSLIHRILASRGRLIVTVPHPFVDKILDVLTFFKMIDGIALQEHTGLEPIKLFNYLSTQLQPVKRRRFQLGLNYLFVFEKV